MKYITETITPFLSFCALNTYFVKTSKRGFGYSIPLVLMLSAIFAYISQFVFKSFIPGFICLFALALGGLGFLLYEVMLKKDTMFCKNYFSGGFYAFVVVFLFFAVTDVGRHFSAFDEFTHWGKMVKEMFRTDRFYSESTLLLTHHDYPPLMPLFEYVWCRLAGNMSEQNMTTAVHVFEFSLVVPMLTEFAWKDRERAYRSFGIAAGILFVVLFTVKLLDEENVFDSIYLDALVPMMFCCIIMFMDNAKSKADIIAAAFVCACFVLVKQICLLFFELAALYFVMRCFDIKKKDRLKEMIINTAVILIVTGVSFFIWKWYTKTLCLSGQFRADRIPALVMLASRGWEGTSLVINTFGKYMRSLFMLGITNGVFSLSYFGLFVIMIAVLHLVCRLFADKRTFVRYTVIFAVGGLVYGAVLCVLYLTCFSEAEMQRLASYGRYMGSYFTSEALLILYIFVKNHSQKSGIFLGRTLTLVACAFVLMIGADALGFLVPGVFFGEPMEKYRLTAGSIEKYAPSNARVFVIDNEDSKSIYYINYYLNYCTVDNTELYEGLFAKDSEDKAYWRRVKERINANDYVYTGSIDEKINECIGACVKDGELQSHTLYKVESTRREPKLIRLE